MISSVNLHLLQTGEVEKMCWTVGLVVELHWICQLELIVHVGRMTHTCTQSSSQAHTVQHYTLTHEVIVPGALGRDHEESQEPVGEQHLDLLIVRGEVAVRIVPCILVVATPFIAQRSQLVGSERAGTWGEAKREREH